MAKYFSKSKLFKLLTSLSFIKIPYVKKSPSSGERSGKKDVATWYSIRKDTNAIFFKDNKLRLSLRILGNIYTLYNQPKSCERATPLLVSL